MNRVVGGSAVGNINWFDNNGNWDIDPGDTFSIKKPSQMGDYRFLIAYQGNYIVEKILSIS